jgi:lysophospholipase L1-like esterase
MRTLAVVLAVTVSAAAAAGLALTRDGDARRTGTVDLLGDSLNVGLEPYLADELGGWALDSENQEGRTTEEGLSQLDSLDRPLAPVLVVSLGTNDFAGDPGVFARQVGTLLDRVGPERCVVWSTLWLDGPLTAHNDVLRAIARSRRNLVLHDWAALVATRPELLALDGVHGSPEGYAERAELIAALVEDCYPRGAGS